MLMYLSSTKMETLSKLMVYNIFLSGWRDHVLTGRMVPLKIGAESKRVHKYHSHPKTWRKFWTQKGSVTLPPLTKSKVKPNHTKKKAKTKRRELVHSLSRLKVTSATKLFFDIK